MRRKSMRFDSLTKAIEYASDHGMPMMSVRAEKIKRMNFALVKEVGDKKPYKKLYLMTNGNFEEFSPSECWGTTAEEEFETGAGSTLYKVDDNGELTPRLWWRKKSSSLTKAEEARRIIESVRESDIPTIEVKHITNKEKINRNSCTVYPIADTHIGGLSWGQETGSNYDSKIAKSIITKGFSNLFSMQDVVSESAVIAFLGDYMHTDGMKAVTPGGGHLLDTDSRYGKAFEAAYTTAIGVVRAAAMVHEKVEVYMVPGNHDESSSVAMMIALAGVFSGEGNIKIHQQYCRRAYHEYGITLIGMHHGNIKKSRLPLIMATDCREAWGRVENTTWYCGHNHRGGVEMYDGCRVETLESIAPPDAFLSGIGDCKKKTSMQAITYDKYLGETGRVVTHIKYQ